MRVRRAHLRIAVRQEGGIPTRRASHSHWEGWVRRTLLWVGLELDGAALWSAAAAVGVAVIGGHGRRPCGLQCATSQNDDDGTACENAYPE
jgi:hypothetical protein